jgi:hypothetical protein
MFPGATFPAEFLEMVCAITDVPGAPPTCSVAGAEPEKGGGAFTVQDGQADRCCAYGTCHFVPCQSECRVPLLAQLCGFPVHDTGFARWSHLRGAHAEPPEDADGFRLFNTHNVPVPVELVRGELERHHGGKLSRKQPDGGKQLDGKQPDAQLIFHPVHFPVEDIQDLVHVDRQ